MPRAETTKASAGSQPYQSPSYDNSPSSSSSTSNVTPTGTATVTGKLGVAAPPKKKHVCPTCERAFTTSGHLARHSRVHTGERNHKCPFPGCETRCSRADNLQQHYRIHLSPGSRRSSARSRNAAAAAVTNSNSTSNPTGSNPIAPTTTGPIARRVPVRAASAASMSSASSSVASGSAQETGSSTDSIHSNSPPISPPPLEQATMRTLYSTSPSSSSNAPLSLTALSHSHPHPSSSQYHSASQYHSTPPDSPPPLTHATLPATAHHHQQFDYEGSISRGTNSASPDDVGYSLGGPDILQQGVALTNATATAQYSYRTVAAGGYQDNVSGGFGSTGGNYGSPSSSSPGGSSSASYATGGEYSSPATTATSSGLSGTSLHQIHTRHNSPANSLSSRHSISHISSATLSYPPSPVSAQSVLSSSSVHQSGPPTPTYPGMSTYSDDGSAAAYHYSSQSLSQQQQQATTMIHGSYPIHAGGRFDSPSPTLAPIQDGTRYTQQVTNAYRRDSSHQQQHHLPQLPQVMERHQQQHIYQPQPANLLGSEFGMGYHQQQQYAAHAHAHSSWKDVGLRKGLGTLVG